MTCTITKAGDNVIISCSRGARRASRAGKPGVTGTCKYCPRDSAYACDFAVGDGVSCSANLCGQCAAAQGGDVHHCRVHQLRGDKAWIPMVAIALLLMAGCAPAARIDQVKVRELRSGGHIELSVVEDPVARRRCYKAFSGLWCEPIVRAE